MNRFHLYCLATLTVVLAGKPGLATAQATNTNSLITREVVDKGIFHGLGDAPVREYMSSEFPRVAADVVYLWPVREHVDVVSRPSPWPCSSWGPCSRIRAA